MMDFFVPGWVCGFSTGTTNGRGVSRGIGRLPSGREMVRLVPSLVRGSGPAQLGAVGWGRQWRKGTTPPVTPQLPPLWASALTTEKS